MEELHRGLCVLQKQVWAPVTKLSYLWSVSEEEAQNVAILMGEMSLCDVVYLTVDGRKVLGLKVHDLIHDYCLMKAEAKEGEIIS